MPDNDLQRFWAGRAAAARVIAGVATISAALMGFAGSLAAQTVQNGSFSNSTGNLSSTYVPSAASLSNWTVSGTNTNPDPCVVFGNAFGTCGYSPVNVSGLGTDPGATPYFGAGAWSGTNAIISQTISGLQIGRKYLISFYQAAVEDANVTDNGIYWSVNLGTGTALSSTLMNIPSGGASAWAANTATMISPRPRPARPCRSWRRAVPAARRRWRCWTEFPFPRCRNPRRSRCSAWESRE